MNKLNIFSAAMLVTLVALSSTADARTHVKARNIFGDDTVEAVTKVNTVLGETGEKVGQKLMSDDDYRRVRLSKGIKGLRFAKKDAVTSGRRFYSAGSHFYNAATSGWTGIKLSTKSLWSFIGNMKGPTLVINKQGEDDYTVDPASWHQYMRASQNIASESVAARLNMTVSMDQTSLAMRDLKESLRFATRSLGRVMHVDANLTGVNAPLITLGLLGLYAFTDIPTNVALGTLSLTANTALAALPYGISALEATAYYGSYAAYFGAKTTLEVGIDASLMGLNLLGSAVMTTTPYVLSAAGYSLYGAGLAAYYGTYYGATLGVQGVTTLAGMVL